MPDCRYVYTAADVQRMVEGQRSKGRAANTATHKARLQRQLEHAIENDNTELRDRCAAYSQLDEEHQLSGSSAVKKPCMWSDALVCVPFTC